MSQEELAKKLGIYRSAVGMYEQDKRDPNFELLDNMAELFDVDLNYMLGKTEVRGHYPKHGSPVVLHVADDEIYIVSPADTDRVIEAYERASEEIQAAVRRVLGIDK